MTGAKIGAIAYSALVIMYVVLLADKAVILWASDTTMGKLMGAALLVLPAIAVWGIIVELRFGLAVERLAKRIESSGRWPKFNFETRPSGRPTRESADREFERVRELVNQNPGDWEGWFSLGLAYDAASDRKRARGAMRKAVALAREGVPRG